MKGVFNASVFMGRPLYPADITTTVSVYNAETDELVPTLWLDRDGTDELANPHPLAEDGVILFYADPGRYNIVVEKGAQLYREWPDVIISDSATSGTPGIQSVVAGYDTDVDDSDPANPVVSSSFAAANTASSYTLSATNDGQWIDITGSGTVDITCPPESSVTLDDRFVHIISNYSSGTVTIVAGSGVTVRPPPGGTLIVPQYATVGIKKADHAADTYIVFGPTEAA